jgi:hypothetical protein
MRALVVLLAAGGAGTLTWIGVDKLSGTQPAPQPVVERPAEETRQQPQTTPVLPQVPALQASPDLLPVRAAKQPAGLPGQVTLFVETGLPGGLALNAAAIGPYQGWAGFDAARNTTHIVFDYRPVPESGSWIYGVVVGNGVPANLPAGCINTLKLSRADEPRQFPMRPPGREFDPTWVPPFPPPYYLPPGVILPLVGGHMIPYNGGTNPSLPYGGRVTVR